jgi:hypothetical protein
MVHRRTSSVTEYDRRLLANGLGARHPGDSNVDTAEGVGQGEVLSILANISRIKA